MNTENNPNPENDPILELLLRGLHDGQQREALVQSYGQLKLSGPGGFSTAFLAVFGRLALVVAETGAKTVPVAEQHDAWLKLLGFFHLLEKEWLPELHRIIEETREAFRRIRRRRIGLTILAFLLALLLGAGLGAWGWSRHAELTADQVEWLHLRQVMLAQGIDMDATDDQPGTFGIIIGGNRPFGQGKLWKPDGVARGVEAHWPLQTQEGGP